MRIDTRIANNGGIAELIIKSGNMKLTEDISYYNKGKRCWSADEGIIESLITASRELGKVNGESDVEFVLKIAEAFLRSSERQELIERLT